jgi:hypothetical protein
LLRGFFIETGLANLQALSQADAGAAITLRYDHIAASPPNPGGGRTDRSVTTFAYNPAISALLGSLNSVSSAPQTFTVADSTTEWTDDLAVARFNPALGTLNSVNITLTGSEDAAIGAANLGATAATVGVTQTSTLTLALPDQAEPSSSPRALPTACRWPASTACGASPAPPVGSTRA